jgi:hypothetical protein
VEEAVVILPTLVQIRSAFRLIFHYREFPSVLVTGCQFECQAVFPNVEG